MCCSIGSVQIDIAGVRMRAPPRANAGMLRRYRGTIHSPQERLSGEGQQHWGGGDWASLRPKAAGIWRHGCEWLTRTDKWSQGGSRDSTGEERARTSGACGRWQLDIHAWKHAVCVNSRTSGGEGRIDLQWSSIGRCSLRKSPPRPPLAAQVGHGAVGHSWLGHRCLVSEGSTPRRQPAQCSPSHPKPRRRQAEGPIHRAGLPRRLRGAPWGHQTSALEAAGSQWRPPKAAGTAVEMSGYSASNVRL